MDFLIGILLVIIALLIIINFTSISVSDSKFGSGTCNSSNYLISTMQSIPSMSLNNGSPLPQNANAHMALRGKVNLDNHVYDYDKYFFLS